MELLEDTNICTQLSIYTQFIFLGENEEAQHGRGAGESKSVCTKSTWEAKFIMDGISKKLIKDGIHSTIRVIFLALVSF